MAKRTAVKRGQHGSFDTGRDTVPSHVIASRNERIHPRTLRSDSAAVADKIRALFARLYIAPEAKLRSSVKSTSGAALALAGLATVLHGNVSPLMTNQGDELHVLREDGRGVVISVDDEGVEHASGAVTLKTGETLDGVATRVIKDLGGVADEETKQEVRTHLAFYGNNGNAFFPANEVNPGTVVTISGITATDADKNPATPPRIGFVDGSSSFGDAKTVGAARGQ